MTDKELRKAKKSELIEILYFLRKELDDVQAENRRLTERLDSFMSIAAQRSTEVTEESPVEASADTAEQQD